MNKISNDLQYLAVPISDLKHMENNPRVGDVKAVMKSYKTFGQRKPIVAKKDGTVIAGNHQLAAARELGWDKIAVVWVDDNDETATAYAVADNSTGLLGEWNIENLVKALENIDDSLLEATAFSEDDIDDFNALLQEVEIKNLTTTTKEEEYLETIQRYLNKSIRSIVFELELEKYIWAVKKLNKYRETHNIENNAEALVNMLAVELNKKKPEFTKGNNE